MLRFNTLRRRLFVLLGVPMLFCLALAIGVSYFAIDFLQENRLATSMKSDLIQLSDQIDRDYYTLLQMSQQMTQTGNVGRIVERYCQAETQYDRIIAQQDLSEAVGIMTFGSTDVTLVCYYLASAEPNHRIWYSNMPAARGFSPESTPCLFSTSDIDFHVLHMSQNRFVHKDSISLARPVRFSDDEEMIIYVEAYSAALFSVEQISEAQQISYSLVQADEKGVIRFSENEHFTVGEAVELSVDSGQDMAMGTYRQHVWVAQQSRFGFWNILLIPEADYHREILLWMWGIAIVVLIAVGIVAVATLLLRYLVYRPMQMLDLEMERVGSGDFMPNEYVFHIDEFDRLFERFGHMKEQIIQLMGEAREQEKEKARLELDKLYFQINPHFLMNALHSVHWMAVDAGVPAIDRFVYQLNYILSYSLGKTDRVATLRTEIKMMQLYLELQKTRYDFETHFDIEEGDYLDLPTARLILQPLAENAVCHNMEEFGNLWVEIHPVGERIRIALRDDGKGFVVCTSLTEKEESRRNKGIGLRYVRMSLEAFYGDCASLEIHSEPQQGTTVIVWLPCFNGEEA